MRKTDHRPVLERIVLGYSGGLDTSLAIPWLREKYRADVIAVTVDLGQGSELETIRDRALAAGAVRAHVLDAREAFASGYVLPSLKADALYDGRYPMASSLGRALIARQLVEIADIEHAPAIAHGSGAENPDHVGLAVAVRSLNPDIQILAPACEWGMTAREKIDYARAHAISVPTANDSPYSIDASLWGRAIRFGVPGELWAEPPDDIYTVTKSAADCPDQPAYVEVTFERGVPTEINGVEMPLLELIASLVTIAGAHGVGRVDTVENPLTGIKPREVFESPAAVVLHTAHKDLQKRVTTKNAGRFSRTVSLQYAETVHDGLWFTPLREALDAYVDKIQERVSGVIRMKLLKGSCEIVGRRSPFALDDRAADEALVHSVVAMR
jgi:argininosuccinate synthase